MTDSAVLVLPDEGSKEAVIIPSTKDAPSTITSYKDLNSSVVSFQQALAHIGVGKESKVAVVLPNSLEFVVVLLSVMHQRAIAAPINPQYKKDEYKELFRLMGPSVLITTPHAHNTHQSALAAQELGIPLARCRRNDQGLFLETEKEHENYSGVKATAFTRRDISPGDKALLLFTSGTTGTPKAVILSHENLLVAMHIIIDAHKLTSVDRCMIITPLFHVIGIGGSLLTTLFSGGCVIIPLSLPGAFWYTCRDLGVTWFHAVPTLHRLLLAFPRPKQMPRLRFMRSGGSELSPELYRRLQELDTPLLEVYGMTETAPAIFCNRLDSSTRRLAHYPIASTVDVMILPTEHGGTDAGGDVFKLTKKPEVVGEICLRGKSIMSGYADNPTANAESFLANGFFRTGDLGVIRQDGYLRLTGRIKEIINKGGEKISPAEIEHVVLSHDGVREAACFRIADEIYGEEIGLAVALQPDKPITANALKKHVRKHAAMFKVPKTIVIVDSIPTNRTGKPRRTFLSEQFNQGLLVSKK